MLQNWSKMYQNAIKWIQTGAKCGQMGKTLQNRAWVHGLK